MAVKETDLCVISAGTMESNHLHLLLSGEMLFSNDWHMNTTRTTSVQKRVDHAFNTNGPNE